MQRFDTIQNRWHSREEKMKPYHKIHSVFKRDPAMNHRTLLLDEYAKPEFKYLRNNVWIFTEKIDGTNIRIMSNADGTVTFGGRTDNANIPAKLFNRLCELFPPNGKLAEQFPDGACLYGEGYGAGIQKGGGNYSPTSEFVLFDVLVGRWWLEQGNVEEIAKILDIEIAPFVGSGNLGDMINLVSHDLISSWGNFQAEGIVARPGIELFGRNGERIITKLKTKDFNA